MNSARDDGIIHPAGFPHSGIAGSKPACGSPTLFAAYHALLRLSVPRHPPCALIRLTGSSYFRHTHALPSCFSLACSHLTLLSSCFPSLNPNCQITQIQVKARVPIDRSILGKLSASPREDLLARSRKEVIQPQVPLRLPCYDFAPVIELAFDRCPPEGLAHGLRALPTSMA